MQFSNKGQQQHLKAITITTNSKMKKQIIVSVPMSLSRSFRVNNTVIDWATVNKSIKVNVFKMVYCILRLTV